MATISSAAPHKKRIFELDAIRGLAVLMMSTYHLLFDLTAYFGKNIDIYSGTAFWVGRLSAILFMLISGVSSTFSSRSIRRGFIVLGAGMLVTFFSVFAMESYYVRFGILHFFGTVMILKGAFEHFVKSQKIRLAAAVLLIPACYMLGIYADKTSVQTPLLLPLGFVYPGFHSFDYYPLFPWASVFCVGVVLGMLLYKNKTSFFKLDITVPQQEFSKTAARGVLRPLCFIGRHSLIIYLLHQPIILAFLWLFHFAGLL